MAWNQINHLGPSLIVKTRHSRCCDSTRAELICIAECILAHKSDRRMKLIFTDNQACLKLIEKYRNGTDYGQIANADVLVQVDWSRVIVKWVASHKEIDDPEYSHGNHIAD
eukprot:NODE_146_length_15710_cov_0.617385.p6 type:complete len:111 gc:universal NODE_146_length_15710_cov_0.617385:10885-10553(-)